jgi:hypothetical protein
MKYHGLGFWPFTLNEDSKLVLLMMTDSESQIPSLLQEFGGVVYPDKEEAIELTASRHYISKSLGLF